KYAKIRPTVAGYADVEGLAMKPQFEKFMNGNISAEKALSQAEKEGNQILKEERDK
ncbi:TPA: ABC transporter substrate-binding protein, partial [Listeria innocua]|nr:ABC transporter substrate-binding protein [Listeria innocua]